MMRRSIFLYLPSLLGSLIYLARLIFPFDLNLTLEAGY